MTQYSKFNVVYRLQKWMDSVPGQTFLNYAYSWGASIVILGTLFKLTHLPGANFFLFLGMGTEVFVFFLSAFDRPFDKTADGMDLPTHVDIEGEPVEVSKAGVRKWNLPRVLRRAESALQPFRVAESLAVVRLSSAVALLLLQREPTKSLPWRRSIPRPLLPFLHRWLPFRELPKVSCRRWIPNSNRPLPTMWLN